MHNNLAYICNQIKSNLRAEERIRCLGDCVRIMTICLGKIVIVTDDPSIYEIIEETISDTEKRMREIDNV